MALKTTEEIKKTDNNSIIYGFSFDEKKPDDKKLIYEINKNKYTIEFYPPSRFYFFNQITINGFKELPELFTTKGYSRNKVLDYIHRIFKEKEIKKITIERTGKSSLVKQGNNLYLHISYRLLSQIADEVGSMNFYHGRRKTQTVKKLLYNSFPELIEIKIAKNAKQDVKIALHTLSAQSIESFEKDDIGKLTDMLATFMKSPHKSQIKKSELFRTTKLKIDTVTLDDIIENYEKLLSNDTTESEWGIFLQENLFLIDSKYIHSIPQLNLVLGGSRKVDFGLVDIFGYLDIFEIKKPETKLLTSNPNNTGNYVWDKQALDAIVQAEKYSFHAASKRNDLKEDIRREKNIDLDIIRPRGIILMGHSNQFDDKNKKDDFQILKNQFKYLDIVLYDELLERIKNQKKSLKQ